MAHLQIVHVHIQACSRRKFEIKIFILFFIDWKNTWGQFLAVESEQQFKTSYSSEYYGGGKYMLYYRSSDKLLILFIYFYKFYDTSKFIFLY